ncbi:MAG: ASKHA domain-containing protein [Thermodesulfobacteriota bacterium]
MPLPIVRKVFLKLPPPSLKDNTAEIDRLKKQIKGLLGIDTLTIPFSQLPSWGAKIRAAEYQVTATLSFVSSVPFLLEVETGDTSKRTFGLAVDLGTTRLAYQLWDLNRGTILAETGSENPQTRFGADILTRIHYAGTQDGLEEMQSVLVSEINRMTATLCRRHEVSPQEIMALTLAGNTTMTHLFLGLNPTTICREPYIPLVNSLDPLTAQEVRLNIHPRAVVYCFPNVGSYLGGDVLAGILHSRLHEQKALSLLVDVGTNAEVAFGNSEWLIGCAGAAGPALEGGVARMGMVAGDGAIEKVRIDPRTGVLTYAMIGEGPPKGICGSGLIDLTAELFMAGLLDIRGKFNLKRKSERWVEVDGQPAFLLVPAEEMENGQPITLTQVDLDILLRSKAAMYTILTTLVQSVGYELKDIEQFFVAGAFGNHIDPEKAITLGLLPDLPLERYIPLGNTSLKGAADVLLDYKALKEVQAIAERLTYLEMNVNQDFMNRFSAARFIPHTDPTLFPSVHREGE